MRERIAVLIVGLCLIGLTACPDRLVPAAGIAGEPESGCQPVTAGCSFDRGLFDKLYDFQPRSASEPTCGTTYYLDSVKGDDAADGKSEATPWRTTEKVKTASLSAGDCVRFKRGSVWRDQTISVPASGREGSPVTIGAYGTGPRPIIDVTASVTGWDAAGNWQRESAEVWSTGVLTEHPGRLWLSDQEFIAAQTRDKIDARYRWFYDRASHRLFLWAAGNPADSYTDVVQANGRGTALEVVGKDYVTIQNLDLRGGYNGLGVWGSNHIVIESCDIGFGANIGIWVSEKPFEPKIPSSDGGIIRWCRIDSGCRLQYDYEKAQSEDGIHLRSGANGWDIYENKLADWGHNAIALWQSEEGKPVNRNKVRRNFITSVDVSYGRGYSTIGRAGGCAYNEFFGNVVRDTSVQNQIGGDHNLVHDNLFDTVRSQIVVPGMAPFMAGQALALATQQSGDKNYVTEYNEIYNNIFYRTDGPAIDVNEPHTGFRAGHNVVRNNLLVDTGLRYWRPDAALKIGDTPDGPDDQFSARDNRYQNNVVFRTSGTPFIWYRGEKLCMADLGSRNGQFGDVFEGNVQLDPRFNDPEGRDFTFKADSPCK